jgi:citrate lyase beta subunit
MRTLSPLQLGASLYMPATRGDLAAHANGEKLPFLRSMIFCTEDAVRLDQLDLALQNLKESLPLFRPTEALRFIRVRNPQIMGEVLRMPGIKNVDGFVLPKATRKNITRYLELLSKNDGFLLMPTLEDSDVFVPAEMVKFRNFLLGSSVRSRILSLRIGGSDLLHQLGVRRSPRRSVYDTALGPAIAMLSGIFIPHGFNLSAPVFEGLAFPRVLAQEVERDLLHGLFGKTAVHPDQVAQIEKSYMVAAKDFEMASLMVEHSAPAVFRMHDTMCEAATHRHWAESVLERARIYGITGKPRPRAKLLAFPCSPPHAAAKAAAGGPAKRRAVKIRPAALATA